MAVTNGYYRPEGADVADFLAESSSSQLSFSNEKHYEIAGQSFLDCILCFVCMFFKPHN